MAPIHESFVVEEDSLEAIVLAQVPLTFDELRCCDFPEQHLPETTSKDSSPLKYKRKRSKLQRRCRNFSSTQVENAGAGVTQIRRSLSGGMRTGTGQRDSYVGSGSGETKGNNRNECVPRATPRGINFYKRIGRWAAHLWAEGKQYYLGSYPSASQAASAFDKASLKHFPDSKNALDLNYEITDYLKDQAQMDTMTNKEYRDLLKELAKVSKPNHVAEGITLCPKGWYEVKIRVEVPVEEKAPPKKKVKTQKVNAEGVPTEMIWLFLGKFRTLKEAKRCYRNDSKGK